MLERNSNLFNKPFGLNVQVPTRTLKQIKQTAEKAVSGLWEPAVNYLEKADDVYSGNVRNEIDKYNRMAYSFGAIMRQGQPRTTFNMKG